MSLCSLAGPAGSPARYRGRKAIYSHTHSLDGRVLLDPPVELPLPFVNLKNSGGISDLNHPPHFSRRAHGASRLAQTPGIIFVGHDKETAGGVAPQLDGQAFQHVFKRLGLPRFLRSIQGLPRDAQIVRHYVFPLLEVRHKRDKRGKRGKPSLPLTFPRFSRFSRTLTGRKPALDRSAAGVFLLELSQAAFDQAAQRVGDLLG